MVSFPLKGRGIVDDDPPSTSNLGEAVELISHWVVAEILRSLREEVGFLLCSATLDPGPEITRVTRVTGRDEEFSVHGNGTLHAGDTDAVRPALCDDSVGVGDETLGVGIELPLGEASDLARSGSLVFTSKDGILGAVERGVGESEGRCFCGPVVSICGDVISRLLDPKT